MSTTLKTAGWGFFIHRTGEIHAMALQAALPIHNNRNKETKHFEILDHVLVRPLSLSVSVHTPTPPLTEHTAVFLWARKPYTFHAN